MKRVIFIVYSAICCLSVGSLISCGQTTVTEDRPRIIVTSDGEIDDECSMVRFLLYTNDWDVEAIITSSSQYHWHGHGWAGDNWIQPYFDAYEQVYPNLLKHDRRYPSPDYLRSHYYLGNVEAEGEMEQITPGSQRIVEVLLDESDPRPVWLQAWGGPNTIARALKTIEEEHPEKMAYVASKCRFFFIWEQDDTYQKYIRPSWEKYHILTIISDQFEAIAYRWRRLLPREVHPYFEADWTQENLVKDHGPLLALYKARDNGEFRSEGDSPSYMHEIVTGLRNLDHPDWGGWGGRYVNKRANVWFDKVTGEDYVFPEGRYYASNGRSVFLRSHNPEEREAYIRPIAMWAPAFQNDFAARADWCVKSYKEANHQPVVRVKVTGGSQEGNHKLDIRGKAGETLRFDAGASKDPDGDKLTFRWFQYKDACTYEGEVPIETEGAKASLVVPADGQPGATIHVICEVTDNGTPALTRYQRIVITL